MKEDVDKIIHETNEVASRETAHLSTKHRDAATYGRVTRHINLAEKNAAEEYYKKSGKYFDVDNNTETHIHIIAMIFAYAVLAILVNLILYLPVNYLTRSWGDVNKHDAVYITIIINTIISTVTVGLMVEISTKRKAFIAGMRAEADDHIISKYHVAKNQIDKQHASKGHIPFNDYDWKD